MNHSIYLFDFDYTLVNSEKGIVGCFHRTLKKYGLPDVPDQRLRRTIGLPMVHDDRDVLMSLTVAGLINADFL